VIEFAQLVVPTAQERAAREAAFEELHAGIALEMGRDACPVVFGSGASGLALHTSDIDVSVTGETEQQTGVGLVFAACLTWSGFAERGKRSAVG